MKKWSSWGECKTLGMFCFSKMNLSKDNLYQPPADDGVDEAVLPKEEDRGFGRIVYLLSLFSAYLILPMFLGVIFAAAEFLPKGFRLLVVFLLIWGAPVAPTFYRLRNVGGNPHLAWLTLVPILNLAVMAYGLCAPTGYYRHRKWDDYSVMAMIFGGIVIVLIIYIKYFR